MKPMKISVFLATVILLLSMVDSLHALTITAPLELLNSDDAKYEVTVDPDSKETKAEFTFDAVSDSGIKLFPVNWFLEVTWENGLISNSHFKGYDLIDKTIVNKKTTKVVTEETNVLEGKFEYFELLPEDGADNLFHFYGKTTDIKFTNGEIEYGGPLFFDGLFLLGVDTGFDAFKGYITNVDPGPPGGTAPVPEPATMMLVGTGMLCMAAVRRKMKK